MILLFARSEPQMKLTVRMNFQLSHVEDEVTVELSLFTSPQLEGSVKSPIDWDWVRANIPPDHRRYAAIPPASQTAG